MNIHIEESIDEEKQAKTSKRVTFRFGVKDVSLLDELSNRLGLKNHSSVIRVALRTLEKQTRKVK